MAGIRSAVEKLSEEEALACLTYYYTPGNFTGAHFESLGSGHASLNVIGAADLLAVSTLAVSVPAQASIAILEEAAEDFNALLELIPNRELSSLSESEYNEYLGPQSAAQQLWDMLRRNGDGESRWGIGSTIASKIMARKRPHLIPIEDSVVNGVIGLRRNDSWKLWWQELREDQYLTSLAGRLRAAADLPYLSTLRIFDVILWMTGKNYGHVAMDAVESGR